MFYLKSSVVSEKQITDGFLHKTPEDINNYYYYRPNCPPN